MKTLGIQVIILQIFTGHLCSAQEVKILANHEAILGGNVTIKCALMGSDNVLQVTWQKLNGHSEKNIATFSKTYGSNIVGSFEGRATFIPSEVTESIINLSELRFEDEGCYRCLFNTFPDGTKFGKTCLSVHVMPEPILQFSPIDAAANKNGYHGFVATCSATGRPAPVIMWDTMGNVKVLSTQSSTMVLDGRVKITSNLTVATTDAADCKVICVVKHPALEKAIILEDFLKTTSSDQWRMKLPILIPFAILIIVVVCLVIWNWRNKLNYFKSLIWNKGPGIPPITKTPTTIPENGILEHFNNLKDPAEESFISRFSQSIKEVFSPLKVQNYSPDKVTLNGKSPIYHRNVTCHSRNSSPYETLCEFTHHICVTISPSTPSLHLRKSPFPDLSKAPCDRKEKSCKRSLQEKFVV